MAVVLAAAACSAAVSAAATVWSAARPAAAAAAAGYTASIPHAPPSCVIAVTLYDAPSKSCEYCAWNVAAAAAVVPFATATAAGSPSVRSSAHPPAVVHTWRGPHTAPWCAAPQGAAAAAPPEGGTGPAVLFWNTSHTPPGPRVA